MDKWTIDLSASFIPFPVQKQSNFCRYRQEKDNKWTLRGVLKRRFSSYFFGGQLRFSSTFSAKTTFFSCFFEKSLQLSHDLGQAPPNFASEIINQFINQLKK